MTSYETMDPFGLRDALSDLDGEQENVVYEGCIHSSCENYLAGRSEKDIVEVGRLFNYRQMINNELFG